jgi:preprotein translocase subunit SecE
MSVEAENQSNSLDLFKWLLVFAALGGAVAGNYYFGEMSILYRAVGVVVAIGVALLIAAQTEKGKSFVGFAKESRIEVRKVVWPTRQETVQTTFIIFAAVVVMSLLLWGLDGVIVWLLGLLTGLGI